MANKESAYGSSAADAVCTAKMTTCDCHQISTPEGKRAILSKLVEAEGFANQLSK